MAALDGVDALGRAVRQRIEQEELRPFATRTGIPLGAASGGFPSEKGYRQHSCRVEGRRVAGRASVALPTLSPRAAVRRPWVRFLPPLSEPGVPISGTLCCRTHKVPYVVISVMWRGCPNRIAGDIALGRQGRMRALALSVEHQPPDEKRHSEWQVYGTVLLKLRMMGSTSRPVLPPSFMPKVTIQRIGFKKEAPWSATMHVTNVVAGHHSNGQTNCPFRGQPRGSDGECVMIPVGAPTRDVNAATGSFSTHYIQVSKYWQRSRCHRAA